MLTKGAVTYVKGQPFQIESIQLDDPKYGEVLVRMVATGLCHTDLSCRDQLLPTPLPTVLGHEGAGVVEKVGDGVKNVNLGDHVILSFASCGSCPPCLSGRPSGCEQFGVLNLGGKMHDGSCRLHQKNGENLGHFFGQSSFAAHAVVSERNVIPVPKDLPLELLGPLGCGIQTGSGAVMNRLKPEPGSSIAVFGVGSVGLSAIMAAKAMNCSLIVAIDIHDNRLKLAKELGATHTINSTQSDVLKEILELTSNGVNYTVDTTGRPEVLRYAVDSLTTLGTAAVVGAPPAGTEVTFGVSKILNERTITGVLMGSGVPQIFIPQLIELYKQQQFPFDKLIKFYDLEEINLAVEEFEKGTVIKPVIVFNS